MQDEKVVKNKKTNKHRRLVVVLSFVVVAMFGFGYALVPLYDALCNVLGINGKTGGAVTYDQAKAHIDKSRYVTVQFIANNNKNLPWKFHPNTKKVRFHPGEVAKISYFAENDSGKTMTVQAIPSVTPGLAAKYLKKTECFCFNQQTLKSQAKMDMPLLFHIAPDLPKNIHTITLSYTLFDVTNKKLRQPKKAGKL